MAAPLPGPVLSDVCPWIVKPLIVTPLALIPIPFTQLMIVSNPDLVGAHTSAFAP